MSEVLAFRWSPTRQSFRRGSVEFVNDGTTGTSPSHDVAHLILAAGSDLPWLPRGTDEEVRIAEFNAVVLEHLLDRIVRGFAAPLEEALRHADEFVREKYAPFPVPFDVALEEFKDSLDVESVVRLAPIFVRMRAYELARPDFMRGTYSGTFRADARPAVGETERAVLALVRALDRLMCGCGCSSC